MKPESRWQDGLVGKPCYSRHAPLRNSTLLNPFSSPYTPRPKMTYTLLCRTLVVLQLLLFAGAFAHASDAPEAPSEPCRQCGALRYFPASAAVETGPDQPTPDGTETGLEQTAPDAAEVGSDEDAYIPGVVEAQVLVREGVFDQALDVLRPLAQVHPKHTHILFLRGLAAIGLAIRPETGDDDRDALLDEAVASLHTILIDRPDLVRVRLELARAFFLQEEDDLAREQFDLVLAGQLPDPVVANVRKFLIRIRTRRRWTGYFGFSLAPDTNINAASDAEIIYIGTKPFRRSADSKSSSDIGVVSWGGGQYQYPVADRWRLRTGFDLNHREYQGGQFDQTFAGVYAGPRWLFSRTTEMSLLATASRRWWGGSSFNYDFGARLEVQHRVLPGLWASGRASWQDRKYQQQTFLEGPLMVVSLSASYALFPTVRVNALVGYQQQDTKVHRWTNAGYWTRVGTSVALPWGFTVGASGEFRWTDYEGQWGPFVRDNSAREDRTRILQASLLNRAITVYGFSPQLLFSNQVRESNAQQFDFKRNLVEMRWVRQF